ncbi:hypothetical protein EX895_002537 [Sporisorium graminicola]|uniref:Uncharacterized protein n=1 Tax=Sporisorium graminicola TaxID=280036 RepID=A0A4U7KYP4_9BASI|nr:hypothetical protein EX895_002537 [Sporisorium graminicola]TKY88548.1 hypothetical protein EX895_002537 [Sporisorium graminicola]DBA11399.1 TPA_inf: RAD52 [Sporisorium graminicola]
MNPAAAHSAKLIAEFEKQQDDQQQLAPAYPSEHPFGASKPGPFGGAGGAAATSILHCDAFAPTSEMTNFADWDAGYSAAPANATTSPSEHAHPNEAGPSRVSSHVNGYQPRALTQYDYPGGWGAQTLNGVGGLTQDSASRIATLQAKLNQRLGPEYLSQRPGPGGGKKLTYIEGWKLVDLANEVFGFNGWSTTIVRLDVDFLDCSPDGTRFNAGVSCVVRVTLRDGAFHEDIGYGSAENARQKHAALEKGKKEAVTDATKRTLKNFGKLLGNCTYDHQYSANALKVSNPPPKFDASELHRRPELRPPAPPAPQPQPPQPLPLHATGTRAHPQQQPPSSNASNPPVPQLASRAAQPATTGTDAKAPTRALPSTGAPQQQASSATNSVSFNAGSTDSSGNERQNNMERRSADDTSKDEVSERQQRSMLARQAYLERQQAEARRAEPVAESHQIVTTVDGAQKRTLSAAAAEVDFGSDSFDDGLSEVLAGYDETSMGDAEAASHALEMEIDEAQRQHPSAEQDDSGDASSALHYNGADDSGVAFTSSENALQVKREKVKAVEMRRSTSPVKQVKVEAAMAPRRAGSVGRFISPPPLPQQQQQSVAPAASTRGALKNGGASLATGSGGSTSGANLMRNGTTSLSAASVSAGGSRTAGMNPPSRRRPSTTLSGLGGGVEGAAESVAVTGSAYGEPVNHGFVPGNTLRGIKRPNEVAHAANGRTVGPPGAPAAASNAAVRNT